MTKILVDSELLEWALRVVDTVLPDYQEYRRLSDSLRAALDAPSVPEGWQPISTAPKDGTKLLLCVEGFEASTGCFHPDFNRWTTFPIDGFEEKKEWERWFAENEYKPTLWMRLPTLSAAPKAPTTDERASWKPLYTHPAPSVPEGWQLVPKNPTPEMIDAFVHGIGPTSNWAYLLSAAPKASTTDDRKDAERWRYIRRHLCLTGNGDGTCQMYALNLPCRIQGWPEIGESLQFHDAAIDSAIAAQKGEKE